MISSRSAVYVASRLILRSMYCFNSWCAMPPQTIPCLMASLMRSLDCCSHSEMSRSNDSISRAKPVTSSSSNRRFSRLQHRSVSDTNTRLAHLDLLTSPFSTLQHSASRRDNLPIAVLFRHQRNVHQYRVQRTTSSSPTRKNPVASNQTAPLPNGRLGTTSEGLPQH